MPRRHKVYYKGDCPKTYMCVICKKYSTTSLTGLKLHEKKNHPEVNPNRDRGEPTWMCEQCSTFFKNRAQLDKHKRTTKCYLLE